MGILRWYFSNRFSWQVVPDIVTAVDNLNNSLLARLATLQTAKSDEISRSAQEIRNEVVMAAQQQRVVQNQTRHILQLFAAAENSDEVRNLKESLQTFAPLPTGNDFSGSLVAQMANSLSHFFMLPH